MDRGITPTFPFNPDGQPDAVRSKPPEAINILTALAENEQLAKVETDPIRKSIVGNSSSDSCITIRQ